MDGSPRAQVPTGILFAVLAGVGFIALSGVSVLNTLVLLSAIRHNLVAGQPLRLAIEHAAETRMQPMLMTALMAGLGFLPMATSSGMGARSNDHWPPW